MSEQSLSMPAEAPPAAAVPFEPVPRVARFVSAISDYAILYSMALFGGFVGLFVEDAAVQNLWLQPMEDAKHGAYGLEFMLGGVAIAVLYVAYRNFVTMRDSSRTVTGQVMRSRIVTMDGQDAGMMTGFVVRICLPVLAIVGVGAYLANTDTAAALSEYLFQDRTGERWGLRIFLGQTVSMGIVGAILVLPALLTGRCLHDFATGTQVVWANDVDDLPGAIHLSEALRRFVDAVGRFGSWWIVPVVIITCFDVIARKAVWTNDEGIRVGIQIWLVENFGRFFDSTLLQEMEWHSHTILFAFVLGYGYINNTHVRVDLLRERFHFRTKAKLEFFGLTFFLIPYCLIVTYFAGGYAVDSYYISEISASQVGLPMRWVIKTLLTFGLFVVVAAGISVWLQVAVALWGRDPNLRYDLMTLEWPEEEGTKIEGKERLDLAKVEDELEKRARASGHLNEESNDSR